jgi:hypothetical protein
MGRIVDQNVKSTFKMTAGDNVTAGDLLYAPSATSPNPKSVTYTSSSVTSYSDSGVSSATTLVTSSTGNTYSGQCQLVSGDYIIAWCDTTTIKFQRYNSSWVAQGSTVTVEVVTSNATLNVAALTGGGFVLAYNNTTTNVRAAVYDSTGTQTVAPFVVEAVAAAYVAVEGLSTGGFIVLYNNTTTNLRYGLYGSSGVLQGSLTTIASVNVAAQRFDVKSLATGNLLITYGVSTLAAFKIISNTGTSVVTQTTIYTSSTVDYNTIIVAPTGAFVITGLGSTTYAARFISNAGVLRPIPQTTTLLGSIPLVLPTTYTASNGLVGVYNSLTGGITLVASSSSSTSYYLRLDSNCNPVGVWALFSSTASIFKVSGIFQSGTTTSLIAFNALTAVISRYTITATANTYTTFQTPFNSSTQVLNSNAFYSTNYTITNSIGSWDTCALTSGDIVTVYNGTLNAGHFTIVGTDGVVKVQKYLCNNCGGPTTLNFSIAALTGGGFVICLSSSAANVGHWFFIYTASGEYVNSGVLSSTANNGSTPIRVVGLTGGGFAATWTTTDPASQYAVYSSTGTAVKSATGTGITIASNMVSCAMAAMADGGFVVINGTSTGNTVGYVRLDASGTITVTSSSSMPHGSSYLANAPISVIGTPDGGWAYALTPTISTTTVLYTVSPANALKSTSTVTTSGDTSSYFKVLYNPITALITVVNNISSLTSLVASYSLTGVVIKSVIVSFTAQTYSMNYSNVCMTSNGTVVFSPSNFGALFYGIITIPTPLTLVGIAAETATSGTEIDVIVDGVTTLNNNWGSGGTFNYLSNNPVGVKGLVTGKTAELTRQRNNLA